MQGWATAVVAVMAIAVVGCGNDKLDKLYIATGTMESALYSEFEMLEIPVSGVDCTRPDIDEYTCEAFTKESADGRAAWATYAIKNPAEASDEGSYTVYTWIARRTAGDTRFPRRVKGWDAVEKAGPD